MASWLTDPHIQYTPYIETNPTDAYLRVGMYKEEQLKAGLQRVQQYVDTITGLPIIKPEDKDYVQNKLSSLKNGITKNLSGDFSDSRIVNQIAGAAKQIYSDPIVQNSVQGTMAYKAGLADIETAQKAGKSSVENEWDFNNGVNKWLSDKTVGSKSSQYFDKFIPYTDVNKKWMDIQKDLGADETSRDLPFLQDAQGNYIDAAGKPLSPGSAPVLNDVMITKIFKGKSPQKIKAAIMASMDENDIRQLGITGKYHYKDLSPQQLQQFATSKQQEYVDKLNSQLQDLNTLKTINPSNAPYQAEVDKKIEAVKQDYENSTSTYENNIKTIATNPDAFKANMYMSHALNDFSLAFSNYSDIQKIVNSPYIEKMEKDRSYNLAVDNFKLNQHHTEFLEGMASAEYKLKLQERQDKLVTTGLLQPGSLDQGAATGIIKPTTQAFKDDLEADQANISNAITQFKQDYFNDLSNQEFQKQLAFHQDAYNTGKETRAEWTAFFDNNKALQDNYNRKAALLKNIQEEADKKFPEVNRQIQAFQAQQQSIQDQQGRAAEKQSLQGFGDGIFAPKEKTQIPKTFDVQGVVPGSEAIQKIIKPKQDWINQQIALRAVTHQPSSFGFNTSTPERQAFVKSGINQYLTRIESEGGKQEAFPQTKGFDLASAKSLLDDPKTKIGVIRQGSDRYITLQGVDAKNKPLPIQTIATNASEFSRVFGESGNSPAQPVVDLMAQWGNTNIESGNKYASIKDNPNAYKTSYFSKIRGGSELDNFPRVNKYNIKADTIVLPNGKYQTIFYIEQPKTGAWKTYDGAVSTDINALIGAFQMIDDATIAQILK